MSLTVGSAEQGRGGGGGLGGQKNFIHNFLNALYS